MHLEKMSGISCSVSMPECPAMPALMCLFLVGYRLPVSTPECLRTCFPLASCIGLSDLIYYYIVSLFLVSYMFHSLFLPLISHPICCLHLFCLLALYPFI